MRIDFDTLRHEARVLIHHMGLSFHRMNRNKKTMYTGMFGMLLNNIMFFLIWVLIFRLVPDLKGWALPDVALMYGLGATCFGLAGALFGGFRFLAEDIETGKFDHYLAKPTSSFTLSLTSATTPHAWGDTITGPVFWLIFCHLSIWQILMLIPMAFAGAVICASVGVSIYAIAFWVNGARNHADTLLYWTVGFLTMPLHGMPYWIKMLLFTVMPMAYVSYLPVEMIRAPSVWIMAAIFGGALWSLFWGRFIFNRGLRQYKGVSTIRLGG